MTSKERFKAYVAAYLVLRKDGQILLLKRLNTGYQDGNYSLVSGHLDGGETAGQCMIREALEEANIILRPEDLQVAHVQHRLSPEREYFDIFLTADQWQGEIENMEPEKCSELRWAPVDDLPSNIVPDVKEALVNIDKGVHYGECGW